MNKMVRIILSLLALVLANPLRAQDAPSRGFDPETILALKGLQLLDHRMNAIGYRLVEANSPFCTDPTAQTGLLLHGIDQYPDHAVASYALGIDGLVAVSAVAPDSPGAAAGLLPGDDILAIEGKKVEDIALDDPAIASEPQDYRRIAAVNDMLEQALADSDVTLDILRGGEQVQVTVKSRPAARTRTW